MKRKESPWLEPGEYVKALSRLKVFWNAVPMFSGIKWLWFTASNGGLIRNWRQELISWLALCGDGG